MQRKSGIMKSGLDPMPLFLLDDLLRHTKLFVLLRTKRINKINNRNLKGILQETCKKPTLECSKDKQVSHSFTILLLDSQLSK